MRRAAIARLALVVAIAAAASLGPGSSAATADEGWTVDRFAAEILIRADGSLDVVERIDVDFGDLQKHGIFRYIPVRYHYDDASDRVYDLREVSVTDAAGRAWQFERSDDGGDAVLKIGDPDRTVNGKQTYVIAYQVAGALNGFADHDELYWNVNGEWPVVTAALTATVRLERGAAGQVACFQGRTGSSEACSISARGGQVLASATRALAEDEQATIVVAFPKGLVPEPAPLLRPRQRDFLDWWDITPFTVGGALIVLVAGISFVGWRWVVGGRDPSGRDTIVPEYEPPERLRPAEVGLLVDERADTKDLTATIVDLGVRGYLRIEEIAAHGLFGKADWLLRRERAADEPLAPYERKLLEGLFVVGDEVKLSALKGTFHPWLSAAQKELYRSAVERGWFPADPTFVRNLWVGIGIAVFFIGAGLAALLGVFAGAAIVGVALAVVGIAALVMGPSMPRRSAAGRDLRWHIRGFERYMETAETERQRFAERENIFAAYLPYAIVLGLVGKWAAAFKDVDLEKATRGWYTGGSFANVAAFSSGLESFSGGLGSAISSTPGSSGSSGFGGGSGGGGGGGGGGSW